jgi:hypothetical protein
VLIEGELQTQSQNVQYLPCEKTWAELFSVH